MELKPQFDKIQNLFNYCIGRTYQVLTDRIASKSAYLGHEQMKELEQQEYIRTADDLAQLYLRYSALSDIRNCYSDPSFLWESGFFEALNPREKKSILLSPSCRLTTPDMSRIMWLMMPSRNTSCR